MIGDTSDEMVRKNVERLLESGDCIDDIIKRRETEIAHVEDKIKYAKSMKNKKSDRKRLDYLLRELSMLREMEVR
jgi:hypothetical protein